MNFHHRMISEMDRLIEQYLGRISKKFGVSVEDLREEWYATDTMTMTMTTHDGEGEGEGGVSLSLPVSSLSSSFHPPSPSLIHPLSKEEDKNCQEGGEERRESYFSASLDELKQMKICRLKELCKANGLKQTGNKDVLIQNLRNHFLQKGCLRSKNDFSSKIRGGFPAGPSSPNSLSAFRVPFSVSETPAGPSSALPLKASCSFGEEEEEEEDFGFGGEINSEDDENSLFLEVDDLPIEECLFEDD